MSSSPRIYRAEHEVFGKRFGGYEHGMALADARALVQRYAPDITVVRSRSESIGSVYYEHNRTITLGRYAGLPIVLHELAHALTPEIRGHGVAFMQTYLRLVEAEMSPWWARRLRAAIRRHQPRGYRAACR